jgi:hypothetical protein
LPPADALDVTAYTSLFVGGFEPTDTVFTQSLFSFVFSARTSGVGHSVFSARHGKDASNGGHQSCSVGGLNVQPQGTRPRNIFNILRTQLVPVDDEGNQACLQVFAKSSRKIQRRERSAAVECYRHDCWLSLEDTSGVRFIGRNRLHSETRTNEGLRVTLIAATHGFNQHYKRLLWHRGPTQLPDSRALEKDRGSSATRLFDFYRSSVPFLSIGPEGGRLDTRLWD